MPIDTVQEMIRKIVKKLQAANIKYIISIDDNWKPDEKEIDLQTSIESFLRERKIKLPDHISSFLRNESDIQTIEDLLSSNKELLNELKNKIKRYISSGNEKKIDPYLNSLNTLFEEIKNQCPDIIIEKLHDWDFDLSQYSGNCLYILDKNMGGKKTDVIVDSILKIIESGNTKNDLILIYSNESISEYRDNQSKLKHIEDKLTKRTDFWQLIIYKMWAIKKSGNLSNLLPQLYKMLLCSIYGNALYNVIHYKLDVEKSAYKDLIVNADACCPAVDGVNCPDIDGIGVRM